MKTINARSCKPRPKASDLICLVYRVNLTDMVRGKCPQQHAFADLESFKRWCETRRGYPIIKVYPLRDAKYVLSPEGHEFMFCDLKDAPTMLEVALAVQP